MIQYKFEQHKKTLSYMSLQTLLLYLNFFIMTKPIVCNHRGWFIGFLVCYIIQEIGSTALEIVQIREQKPIEYIKDIWNFVDVFRIICSWTYIFISIFDSSTENKTNMINLVSALNILIFSKIFYALNQFKRMRVLIALVKQVAIDIVPFAVFQSVAMLMIGSTSYNLKMTSTDEDGDNIFEYVQGEQFHVSVRSIYLLTLGEFDLDDLDHAQWALFYVGTFLL